MITLPDIIGTVGVSLILVAYFLVQTGKTSAQEVRYPALNLAGATLLLISLLFNWNTPSVIIELCWILISLYGIFNALKKRKHHDAAQPPV